MPVCFVASRQQTARNEPCRTRAAERSSTPQPGRSFARRAMPTNRQIEIAVPPPFSANRIVAVRNKVRENHTAPVLPVGMLKKRSARHAARYGNSNSARSHTAVRCALRRRFASARRQVAVFYGGGGGIHESLDDGNITAKTTAR